MRAIRLNLQQLDVDAVHRALEILDAWLPGEHAHFMAEINEVTFAPAMCPPSALACTGGPVGRRVVLTTLPRFENPIELAVRLSHEARHHYTDQRGWHTIIQHSCRDCSDPRERALDTIYQQDEELRQFLLANVYGVRPLVAPSTRVRPMAQPNFGGALVALGILGLGFGIAATLADA